MKRIRVCVTILGLLACAAVANAQQQLAIPGLSDAQVVAIAGGNKHVQLPPTTSNGTLDLSSLAGLENIVNKTITVLVEQCGNKPPLVYVLLPGQVPPEPEKDCHRWKLGGYVPDGSGGWRQVEPGDKDAPYSVQITGTPAVPPGPVGEGPSIFNFKAEIAFGIFDEIDLQHECAGLSGCSVSDHSIALEAGIGPSFGPFDFLMGGFKTNDVSTTVTETFTGSTGTLTVTSMEKWHVNAFEATARFNPVGIRVGGDREIILGLQGGPLVWTAKGMSTFASSTSPGSVPAGVTTGGGSSGAGGFSYHGTAGWYGFHGQVPICPHLAGTFDFKHADLDKNSFKQNVNSYVFGVSWSPAKPKAWPFEIGK